MERPKNGKSKKQDVSRHSKSNGRAMGIRGIEMKERRIVEVGEYKIIQAANNHIGIYKNGESIFHAEYTKKLNG